MLRDAYLVCISRCIYNSYELKLEMKKVNPKVVAVATLLLGLLIGASVAAEKALGEATLGAHEDTGI